MEVQANNARNIDNEADCGKWKCWQHFKWRNKQRAGGEKYWRMWQFEKWLRAAPRADDMVREQVPAEGRANQGGKKKLG